jgi:hypothetical protein
LDVGRFAAELVSREPHFGHVGGWLAGTVPAPCDTVMNLSEFAIPPHAICFGEGCAPELGAGLRKAGTDSMTEIEDLLIS